MTRILMMLVSETDPDYQGGSPSLQLERFAAPYFIFCDAGMDVVLASREGGAPWVKPEARREKPLSALMRRFEADRAARDALSDTLRFEQVDAADFAGAFCVGAPVEVWGKAPSGSASLITTFLRSGKPVAIIAGMLNLGACGAGEGLLTIGNSPEAPVLAAAALLAIVKAKCRSQD